MISSRLRLAVCLISTIVAARATPAQDLSGSITGKITDPQQAVLAQTTVELLDSSGNLVATVESDATGQYHLTRIAPGSYSIRFTATGFEPVTRSSVKVATGQAVSVDVTLKPERVREEVSVIAEPLADVEPTGSRLGLAPLEIPAEIVEMNSATLEVRGYQQIEQAVENMPGATSGGSPADPSQFATRGFVGNQITLLRDGIYLGPANMITRPQNSFNVESVDLLEGPSSVLYGQGAVGGTVNVITKPADFEKIRYNGMVSYGSFNTFDGGVGAGGEITNQLAFRSDVSYYSSDGYISGSNPDALNITGSLVWKPRDNINLKFAADILRDDLSNYYGTPFVPASFGTDPIKGLLVAGNEVIDARMRYNNYNVDGAVDHSNSYMPNATLTWQISPNVTISDQAYYFHARRRWENAEVYKFLGTAGLETDANGNANPADVIARDRFHVFHDQNMPGNQLNVTWTHSLFGLQNRLVTGYEFYNISFLRSRGFPDGGIPDGFVDFVNPFNPARGTYGNYPGDFPSRVSPTKITDNAAYFEDVLNVTKHLRLVTGLRFEEFYLDRLNYSKTGIFQPGPSFSRQFEPLNYRAGLVYDFASYLTGYGQFSTGQDPIGSNIFLVNASQNFQMSSSRQGEVGLKSLLPNGHGDATLALYYIDRSNLLSPVPGQPDQVENIGKQIAKGAEFSFTYRPVSIFTIDFNTAYTYSRFGSFIDIASGNAYAGTQPANVPSTSTNLWLHLRQIRRVPLEVGAGLRYVGERYADNGNATKLLSYGTLDAYGTYHFTERMSLTLRGRNLTNKAYVQWADIYYPTEVVMGAQRSVEGAFTFRF